jgi:4-hydroxybenzoate polyprenyltransferase
MVRRWWIYQRERFPVLAHGVLIAAFSFSAVGYTTLLRGLSEVPVVASAIAFVSSFLFFLQLRVADEFKDREDDSRYWPDRPVPRGLVSLGELAVIGAVAVVVQLALALWLYSTLILPLAATWAYMALMTVEFFGSSWLRVRSALYLVSHLLILPFMALYATACVWLPVGSPPSGLEWFLAMSYCSGAVLEVGRKIRPPLSEHLETGTYIANWGTRGTVRVWLAALLLTAACAALAASQIDFLLPVIAVLAVLLLTAVNITGRFLHAPDTASAKRLEVFSGVWTILVYLSVGVAPIYRHWWSSAR